MLVIMKVRKVKVIEKIYRPQSSLDGFEERCITGGGEKSANRLLLPPSTSG